MSRPVAEEVKRNRNRSDLREESAPEAQKDLLHDARLSHCSHPISNNALLSIPLLDQARVLGAAGSPLLVKHGMPQEGVSALAFDRVFRIAGSHKVSQCITDTLKVISAKISVS